MELDYCGSENEDGDYRNLVDDNTGNEDWVAHPVYTAIKAGNSITNFVTGDAWYDDHIPCVNCTVTVDGVVHKIMLMWIGIDGIKIAVRAECGQQEALTKLADLIVNEVENMIDDGC